MRSELMKKILSEIPEDVKERVRRKMDEPFSPFGSILPEEWWDWDESNWTEEEYLWSAGGEAWNVDEFSERGYVAMKRMLSTLVDPNKESKTIDEFIARLKQLYDERRQDN